VFILFDWTVLWLPKQKWSELHEKAFGTQRRS